MGFYQKKTSNHTKAHGKHLRSFSYFLTQITPLLTDDFPQTLAYTLSVVFFFQKHTPTKSTLSLSLHCFNFLGSLASLDAPPSTTTPQRGRGEEENLSFDALTRFRAASKGIRATAFKPPHLHMHQRLVSLALVDG